MKNFLQVNRALVAEKKHLLLNQLFGTEGGPNQTDETLTRENRIGLMSYLHRTLMLFFAVLTLSIANIGQMWGASVAEGTYNFVDQTIGAATRFYKIDNGIYQYRLNAYTKNTSLGIQLPASGDGTGFAFHLESTQKVYIGICKKNVKTQVVNNLYIKTITEADFSAIEAGTNNKTTVTLSLAESATLSQNYTFAAISSQKTEGATVYMGELPAGYYYAYGNSTGGNGNLYSITFGTQTLFLVPNDKTGNNAKFAAYYYIGNTGYERIGWSDYMTVSPCNSSTYRVDIPKGYTKLIFVRLNPSGGINWDSKWNQTGDLTFDGSKDLFTWANGSWDGATTTWSASTKYTISFASNGGSESMSNISSIACGRSVTLAANAYEKSGYVFAGWKTNVAVTANGESVAANGIVADKAIISNITSNITLTAQWNEDVACSATKPGALSKGTLSGCSRTITASGSAAANNTWYWQSSESGTDKSDAYSSGKAITETGTYYLRSYCTDGTGCWSDAVSVEITAADMTPAAPTALAKSSVTAKGVTLTVTDAANTNDYEFYVSTSSSAPGGSTPATHSSNTKSITITNLYAGTTFYAWARAKCGSNKSAWTALGDGGNFTTSTVTVTHTLTNVTMTSGATTAGGSDYTAVFAAVSGYSMPTPTITVDGNTLSAGNYTWSSGSLTIPANKINGDIVITLNSAVAAPSSVTVNGNYHIYPGETLSLTTTVTGGNGPKTYQWQKYMGSTWTNLADETDDTYTKAEVNVTDVGQYRCIVTCAGSASTTSGQFDVKCLQLYVYYNDVNTDLTNVPFTKVDDTHAYASVLLSNSSYCYHFKVTDGCGNWWGNNGESGMSMSNHDNWSLNGNHYTKLWTSKAGTYRFNLGHNEGLTSYGMSVVFPSGDQTAGYNLYFANDGVNWDGSKIYYRIGKSNHNNFLQMNLVPGTANLYKVTTTTYGGFEAWHIANNKCGGNSTSIYLTNTNDDYEASEAMMFNGTDIASTGLTVIPDVENHWAGTGDGEGCKFYGYNTVDGMLTHTATVGATTNGSIRLDWTDVSGTAQNATETTAGLAHTCNLQVTAVPATGYETATLTVNGANFTSGSTHVLSADATIAATFSPHVYSITYKDKGGSDFSGTHTDTPSAHPTSHTYNTATDLNGATKTGYTFDGWYTTSACTGDPVTSLGATAYTADITLYAKWTAAASTTYYLVTSTAQLNTDDTYVIMDDGKAAMMGVADGDNTYLNAITSGFTVAGDKSTVTVTSSDVNTLTLQAESSVWNIVGKNNKKLSTKGTVDGKLYANTDKATASNTDDFVFEFGSGKATIKRNTTTNYHIYYDATNTKFIQSETATNIRLYTSNSTPVDATAPTLSSFTPTNGATNVAVSGNIVLTFSENVTIVDASKFTLTGGAGTLNTASASASGAVVTIPYSGLANNTTYTLAGAAGAVRDAAGNNNAALSSFSFTTVAADPECTPETLFSMVVKADASNYSLAGNSEMTTELTDRLSTYSGGTPSIVTTTSSSKDVIKNNTVYVGSNDVYLKVVLSGGKTLQEGDVITITTRTTYQPYITKTTTRDTKPTMAKTGSSDPYTYSITLANTNSASGKDIIGGGTLYFWKNSSAVEIRSITITRPCDDDDETDPTLSSSTPTNGATNVAVSGNIVLTFSENVSIVDASKFTLTGGAGTLNTAGATVSGAVVTIPYSGLANSREYTFSTAAGAVQDGSSNANAALGNIVFTTSAAPAGAPVITVQPTLSEVALGETASFSLTATGATGGYQWYSCDSEGENKTEASGASAATASYSYTTTVTGTTYYICKVSNASGDTWSDVVGSIVNPVSFTIHYEAGSTNGTTYTTETFTQTKEVNAAVEDYIGSLTKYAFTGVGISDKGKNGTMSMMIDVVGDAVTDTVGKRVSFSFVIANNYQLDIDDIDFQVQAVTKDDESFQVVMTDQVGTTIVGTLANPKNGNLTKISFTSDQLAKNLVGKVNVVLYGWCTSSETAKYRIAKDFYIRGEVSSLPAPTASWTARPSAATVSDGGKTYTLTTDATNTVAWTIEDQTGATGAALSSASGLTTTLRNYSAAGSLYVQAAVTGDGIHYLSTPATILRQLVTINGACGETTLISATLSSGSSTGAVTGTPGGTSNVKFEYTENVDGGYKMGKDGSYIYLTLSDDNNFEANDVVKITITKASNIGDGALHIYKYASSAWMELGSVAASGAGTYSYTLTETNVSTAFNTIGLYRTGSNQNPYVKALSVVRSSCSASKPSSVTVTASAPGPYAIGATPTLTVTATNAETYQWYSNTSNTASDGFLLEGETATTYSPSTTIAGTTYYYCVATNTSGSTVSNIITVTVNSAKPTPEVSWEDTYETPNYGGGGYAVKATVSTGAWDGTLTTDMLTASDGVTLSDVSVSGKVITATYGVTEAARSPIAFTLTLPETTNYTALEANSSNITFTSCEGSETTTATKIPVLSAYTTSSNPTYRWETADVGWFTWETGASTLSSESGSYSGFSYRTKSGKSSVLFYSELDAVRKVRLYIRGAGTTTLSKVQTGTVYNKYKTLTASTDYNVAYSNASSSIESREDGYIEISFKSYLSAGTFVAITLSRNTYYYGVELITGTEEVGNITTALSWATDPGETVNKYTTDANFRYEAVKASDAASQATLGTISYKSSNTSVATVSATGVVDILGVGNTTITATLASSGCYKKATCSYNLVVAEATCTDEAGTITASGEGITIDGNTVTKTDACAEVTLTVNGHTGDGGSATYQWYKDGVSMGSSYQTQSISVTENGDYTVEVTNAGSEHCTMPATNTITITGEAISITKIVDEWYVKNGRRTPDIALATIEGTDSWKVNDGSADIWVVADGVATTITGFAGCGFELRDGTIYLKGMQSDGSEPSGLTAGDATLTITAVSACGDDPTATITIHKQVSTANPSVAFIVDGTSGNPVNEVATTKTSSRPIWVYLSTFFDLTGCNAYWTNNEKLIRQYYSQFDAIVITDDPNTGTGPTSGKKYVNALGTMVDVRPILTMEAYVGKYGASSNWHIGATPSSPNPRQYEMKLQCKDHDIFAGLTAGANFRSEEVDGETYYYVTMVDNSVTPYKGVADDAETETYPAMQGFSASAIKGTDLLGIGTILNGTLQGGIERQNEPTARMMILGIQHQAMAALTAEGKQVIKNAINYLLMTNMEDVNDCSNFFLGNAATGSRTDWSNSGNWSSGKLPDASTKTRILAPVTISTKVHVAQVDIAVDGTSKHIAGTCNGKVTIASTGALIVDGQVRRTTNGRLFTEDELEPTTPADLVIGSNETNGNGTLIFDNSNGETQATVEYYSKSNTDENTTWNWQYMAVPFNDNSSAYRNYYDSYLYRWAADCSGWEAVPNRGEVYPWVGYCITQVGEKTYYMDGTLVETGEQVFTVPGGKDLVLGNSWSAPIQVKQLTDDDFVNLRKNVYLFNTGYDPDGGSTETGTRYAASTYVTIPIHSATYTGDSMVSSLQAFIVYTDGDSDGTLTLDYDRHVRPARSTDIVNAGPMHAPRRGASISEEPAVLKIYASGSRYDDRLVVLERGDFSTGLDDGWDGDKRLSGNVSPHLYAETDNGKESVSAIPDMEGTLLGFRAGEDNAYTLHFNYSENEALYLLDLENNIYTPVNNESSYTFVTSDKSEHTRFILTRTAPGIATGVTDLDADAPKAQKIIYNDKLYIIRGGKVYSAEGQLVK